MYRLEFFSLRLKNSKWQHQSTLGFIFYRLFYYTCLSIFPFSPLHPAPSTPSGNPPTIVHVHGSCVQVLWQLHFLHCTLHPHSCSITTSLYFLIPSPLHPLPNTPLPFGNYQNAFRIHDSVSVLLFCLACFLDSIVDRYVFIAILLFIVLILFFLNESLEHFI